MENIDTKFYCRKCRNFLPEHKFYKAVDKGLVDSSGKFSVCKDCAQDIYDTIFQQTKSMEKTIHKMCKTLNVRYTNEAMDAAKAHITTMLENGKNVKAIFSIYMMKLVATNPSMDKSADVDMSYEDINVIFTSKEIDTTEIPIPQELLDFWGSDASREDIEFLEREYANFKATHKSDTHAEVVLLKEVCYTMLLIKKMRANNDDTSKEIKQLQDLMKNLAISPNVANASGQNKGIDTFGLWIQDIERSEPAVWLSTDPRGNMYRDVGSVEEYFQDFVVRPLKNFITMSKDFQIEGEEDISEDENIDFTIEDD